MTTLDHSLALISWPIHFPEANSAAARKVRGGRYIGNFGAAICDGDGVSRLGGDMMRRFLRSEILVLN